MDRRSTLYIIPGVRTLASILNKTSVMMSALGSVVAVAGAGIEAINSVKQQCSCRM